MHRVYVLGAQSFGPKAKSCVRLCVRAHTYVHVLRAQSSVCVRCLVGKVRAWESRAAVLTSAWGRRERKRDHSSSSIARPQAT